MDSPPEVLPLATEYLKIYFIGIPAMMIYNFGSAILRAIGDTKRPLYYLTTAGLYKASSEESGYRYRLSQKNNIDRYSRRITRMLVFFFKRYNSVIH